MNLPAFVERHPKATIFTVAVLGLAGAVAGFNLPISIFPDITFPRIVIIAEAGEDAAERVMVTLRSLWRKIRFRCAQRPLDYGARPRRSALLRVG